jgi:hypothetical protein
MIGCFGDDPTGGVIAMIAMLSFCQLILLFMLIAKSENYEHFLNDYF